jgi:hypothetical protein
MVEMNLPLLLFLTMFLPLEFLLVVLLDLLDKMVQ